MGWMAKPARLVLWLGDEQHRCSRVTFSAGLPGPGRSADIDPKVIGREQPDFESSGKGRTIYSGDGSVFRDRSGDSVRGLAQAKPLEPREDHSATSHLFVAGWGGRLHGNVGVAELEEELLQGGGRPIEIVMGRAAGWPLLAGAKACWGGNAAEYDRVREAPFQWLDDLPRLGQVLEDFKESNGEGFRRFPGKAGSRTLHGFQPSSVEEPDGHG